MSEITHNHSLFEIDRELDMLLDEIEEQTETGGTDNIAPELLERFHVFCHAHSEKVDRIGHFLNLMESRAVYCRAQAAHLGDRARSAENKVERTKNMVLYYLRSRDLKKIEGLEFTLRMQKNSQDSVIVLDETKVPLLFCDIEARIPGDLWQALLPALPEDVRQRLCSSVRHIKPNAEAIKSAHPLGEIPGAQVRRGVHLRVT